MGYGLLFNAVLPRCGGREGGSKNSQFSIERSPYYRSEGEVFCSFHIALVYSDVYAKTKLWTYT